MRSQLPFLCRFRRLSGAMAAGVFLGAVGLAPPLWADHLLPPVQPVAAGAPLPANPRAWSIRQSPPVEVVRRVKDAVVNIHSERTVRAGAEDLMQVVPSQSRVNGMGTGIIIDPRGYIVTNYHVVEDVSSLRVRLSDGTVLTARVMARDMESDLAVLKIDAKRPLAVMPLGTARDLQVAETVVAIGNAYGYDHTVTVGVVSALGRDVNLNKQVRYRSLIQTDAAINPGNSGGPLINLAGELVGVNVAIRAGAQGIGFAIPVDSMITSVGLLMAKVRTGNTAPVGLHLRDEVPGAAAQRRVVVERAEGPADKAGLKKGDVLVKVGDQAVASSLDLERALLDRPAGEKVEVVVRRDEVDQRLTLTLDGSTAVRPTATLTSVGRGTSQDALWRHLGVQLQVVDKSADVSRAFPQLHGGLLINEIRGESPAARAGLRSGDILVGLHQWEMTSMENVLYVLNHPDRATFSPLQFYIVRGGRVHRGSLVPAE